MAGPVLAELETLRALSNYTIIDLRSAEEIAAKPMAADFAVNVVWNKTAGGFDDRAGIPSDKATAIVLN
jgi:hypothetical protein